MESAERQLASWRSKRVLDDPDAGRVSLSALDSRSAKERSLSLARLRSELAEIQGELALARTGSANGSQQPRTPIQVAETILAVLRRMVQFTVEAVSLHDGIEAMFESMWDSPAHRALARSLYATASRVLLPSRFACHSLPVPSVQLLGELQELTLWFAIRHERLILLRHGDSDPSLTPITFLSAEIVKDVDQLGHNGFFIKTSLALSRNASSQANSNQLWLCASLRKDGECVFPRAGWGTWTSTLPLQTDEIAPGEGAFAVLQPLIATNHHHLFDRISLFVPTAALDLPVGVHDLELELLVRNSEGGIEASRLELLTLPIEDRAIRTAAPGGIVAPHANQLWSHDPSTNSEIESVRLHQCALSSDFEVYFDARIADQSGTSVKAEIRLFDQFGTGVLPAASASESSAALAVLTLYPQRPISDFRSLHARIPTSSLNLEAGIHHLSCEIALSDGTGRTICGVSHPLALRIEDTVLMSELKLKESGAQKTFPIRKYCADPAGGITIGAVRFGPLARGGGIIANVELNHAEHVAYGVSVSLHHQQKIVVLDPVWIWGELKQESRDICVPFEYSHARTLFESGRSGKVLARVQVLGLNGQVIFERCDELMLIAPHQPGKRDSGLTPTIARLKAGEVGADNTAEFIATINVPLSSAPDSLLLCASKSTSDTSRSTGAAEPIGIVQKSIADEVLALERSRGYFQVQLATRHRELLTQAHVFHLYSHVGSLLDECVSTPLIPPALETTPASSARASAVSGESTSAPKASGLALFLQKARKHFAKSALLN